MALPTSATLENHPNRNISPRNNAAMIPLCNDRTPLHASSTPIIPVGSEIRCPLRTAITPHQCNTSSAAIAFCSIKYPITAPSKFLGQGIAIKKNATGKMKCRTHARPPTA